MGIYVEINGIKYPASVTGKLSDKDWDNRESKSITIAMTYAEAMDIFVDDVEWYIVHELDEDIVESYDNSEYSIAGSITDHRNGEITVKMGKPTAEELLEMLLEVL